MSKNENLLMNIGPGSDGSLPDEVQHVLLNVGSWLKLNGDAIYGTRPWTTYGEGAPFRGGKWRLRDADQT